MNRLLITKYNHKILSALWDGERVIEFQAEDPASRIQVGDIYIGRVAAYVKNIHAAFMEVQPDVTCFYQLNEGEKVRIGEEFPVQITREAVKTKMACCSRSISLPGRYLVLVSDKQEIAVSTKLPQERRVELREQLSEFPQEYGTGFIVRTNAGDIHNDQLMQEASLLARRYQNILDTAAFRTCHSRLHRGIPAYLTLLQDAPIGSIDEIITDLPEIAEEVEEYLAHRIDPEPIRLRLYTDTNLSLSALYRIDHWLKQALDRRVWLPSGGYLVIDPTEALTVIDVNTGKYNGHKNKDETFLKIDLEAAEELTRQMRLRNLSGIILVDFIDLKSPEYQERLYSHLKTLLRQDVVKSVLVDITPLHLAEITRKKVRKTLREQLHQNPDPAEGIGNP